LCKIKQCCPKITEFDQQSSSPLSPTNTFAAFKSQWKMFLAIRMWPNRVKRGYCVKYTFWLFKRHMSISVFYPIG
jgi:hypothetical protein